MPPRTMLPPHLTRHFYETRRTFLKNATDQDSTPWYQLTSAERAVVESEMELFRQAIRAAEEEQDLLASLDATRAAAVNETALQEAPEPAAAEDAPEDCPCPGCSAVAAFLTLMERMGRKLEATVRPPAPNSFPFGISEATTAGPGREATPEEMAYAEKAVRDVIDQWVAAGKPLQPTDRAMPAGGVVWSFALTPGNGIKDLKLVDGKPTQDTFDALHQELRRSRMRPFSPRV
ncbi:hypothetical protein [Streptomyces hirsutus]|uniref:hypothetical protein n=1 Tax=Streptomyces hirsutus TaxID=35620 RepID=UPI003332D0DC